MRKGLLVQTLPVIGLMWDPALWCFIVKIYTVWFLLLTNKSGNVERASLLHPERQTVGILCINLREQSKCELAVNVDWRWSAVGGSVTGCFQSPDTQPDGWRDCPPFPMSPDWQRVEARVPWTGLTSPQRIFVLAEYGYSSWGASLKTRRLDCQMERSFLETGESILGAAEFKSRELKCRCSTLDNHRWGVDVERFFVHNCTIAKPKNVLCSNMIILKIPIWNCTIFVKPDFFSIETGQVVRTG